jgi:hypothetical protein
MKQRSRETCMSIFKRTAQLSNKEKKVVYVSLWGLSWTAAIRELPISAQATYSATSYQWASTKAISYKSVRGLKINYKSGRSAIINKRPHLAYERVQNRSAYNSVSKRPHLACCDEGALDLCKRTGPKVDSMQLGLYTFLEAACESLSIHAVFARCCLCPDCPQRHFVWHQITMRVSCLNGHSNLVFIVKVQGCLHC